MQNTTNIQPTVHTDIRSSKKLSGIRMVLASGGIAGALLVGGLFGSHADHKTTSAQAHSARTSVTSSHQVHATPMQVAPVSYHAANDYVSMARQAAASAGINQDAF